MGAPGVVAVAGGGDPVRAAARIEAAAAGAGIPSFGMTGALVDGLAVGDWVVAERLRAQSSSSAIRRGATRSSRSSRSARRAASSPTAG